MVLDARGVEQELAVLDEFTRGAYELAEVDLDDLRAARYLAAKHCDLKIGLTDAVNAVLIERCQTNEILTTGQRHFRTIVPLTRRPVRARRALLDLCKEGFDQSISIVAWRNSQTAVRDSFGGAGRLCMTSARGSPVLWREIDEPDSMPPLLGVRYLGTLVAWQPRPARPSDSHR